MNLLIILLTIIINFIVQSTILPHVKILGVVPNTAIIIVVVVALLKGRNTASITGLIIGLLQDITFSPVIGVNGFIYFFMGYLVGMLESKLSQDNILIPFIVTIVSTIAYHLTYYLFMFFLGNKINLISFARSIMIFEILYNSILSIFFYKLFSRAFIVPSLKFGSR